MVLYDNGSRSISFNKLGCQSLEYQASQRKYSKYIENLNHVIHVNWQQTFLKHFWKGKRKIKENDCSIFDRSIDCNLSSDSLVSSNCWSRKLQTCVSERTTGDYQHRKYDWNSQWDFKYFNSCRHTSLWCTTDWVVKMPATSRWRTPLLQFFHYLLVNREKVKILIYKWIFDYTFKAVFFLPLTVISVLYGLVIRKVLFSNDVKRKSFDTFVWLV